VAYGVAAIGLRATEGGEASLTGLTIGAAHWLPWLAGAPLALAAAADRADADRRDGVEALAAAHGVQGAGLEAARMLAAMASIAWAIGAPLVLLALFTAALAARGAVVMHRAEVAVGAAAFAMASGVALGGLAAICGRAARRQGGWLLVAIVVCPWALAELAGHGAWSLPGALDAVLDFTMAGT
jgi:hypothetical protein